MKRINIDTNILVRLIIRDDVAQWEIVHRLIAECRLIVSTTVVLETEWVLRSRYGFVRAAFCKVFEDLLELENVEFQERRRIETALEAHRDGMGFADALHVAATPENATFITFDEALVKLANRYISQLAVELAQ